MTKVAEIFSDFGGPTRFGRAAGVAPSTASEMKRRASIPVEYWPKLVSAAPQYGVHGLTYSKLVEAHTDQHTEPSTNADNRAVRVSANPDRPSK